VKLYTAPQAFWDAMLKDINSAKISIEMEQFSIWDDKIGHRFLEAFEKKNREGVKIRMIADGWGSYPLFRSGFVKKLIAAGVEIVAFNPPHLANPKQWFYRLHKKTLVIDSQIAWLGGSGMKKKFIKFRDIFLRLEGTIVSAIQTSFESVWRNCKQQNYFAQPDFTKQTSDPQLLINYCGYGRKEIYEQMRENIQKAEKSIFLTTSYFFPDRNFFQLLLDKARAGVDVKIILRGKDDEHLPVRFSSSYFQKALRANIGIYRYEPTIIHTKSAIIDGKWATLGSCNLDKFSFYYNMEANLASASLEFIQIASELFATDLKLSKKIELRDWIRRPFYERFFEFLIWPIHNYL